MNRENRDNTDTTLIRMIEVLAARAWPALALYTRLGFDILYKYHYREQT
jgi:hypothetical protein